MEGIIFWNIPENSSLFSGIVFPLVITRSVTIMSISENLLTKKINFSDLNLAYYPQISDQNRV